MKQSQENTTLLVLIGILAIIITFVLWNMNHEENYNSNPWQSGDTFEQCSGNYDECMDICSKTPSIGCPGQCLEEKEYCQEFARYS